MFNVVQVDVPIRSTRSAESFGIRPAINKITALCAGTDRDWVAAQERMEEARNLFRNAETTEFVIVTIPTVMAVAESARLAKALRAESVPVNTIVINQVISCQSFTSLARGSCGSLETKLLSFSP